MKAIFLLNLILTCVAGCAQSTNNSVTDRSDLHFNKLTAEEEEVILRKGTELPFTGKYYMNFEKGTYYCKRCGVPLFKSSDKFKSECGWPSFDDAIPGAVKQLPDADGVRTEIECAKCGAHLGHIFKGEELTSKNTRYCVNSVSLNFTPVSFKTENTTDTAYFAGGCFWGVQYYMQKAPGVISTDVGYIGGHIQNPTYEQVCSHTTGYAESVQIIFDPKKTTYENIARLFFNIHDPTQVNRQGPDIGDQYRSEIFYLNNNQKATIEKLIGLLVQKGFKVVTKLSPATKFWRAEDYHQNYYEKEKGTPYCHVFVKRL
jgi:peptide methionine sulfoxide reductase msrA/msrB